MDYLFVLAGEIPQLVVDPNYRAGAYALQQQIDLAKMTVDPQQLEQISAEARRLAEEHS